MKKLIITLMMSMISIFTMSCDAETLAQLAGGVSGCMLADANNFNETALMACTTGTGCEGDKAGVANCCCEEIVYGCAEADALNYNADAKKCAPCVSGTLTDTAENCCCESKSEGCTNPSATNFDATANVACTDCCTFNTTADGKVFGCSDNTACNYIASAELDCSQEAISDSSNTNCCSFADNATCYFDGNGNGFYESTQTMTTSVCDCGLELGGGWKNVDQVSKNVEVQGCMKPACPEFDKYANVEPQGACCNEVEGVVIDTTTTMYSLLGAYDLSFKMGHVEGGTCVEHTMPGMDDMEMGDWGPDEDVMVLGYGGAFQHYMAFSHDLMGYDIWEYEVDPTDIGETETFDGCEEAADAAGLDYFMCNNFFAGDQDDNLGCWELGDEQPCKSRPDCHWETRFCHFDYEGFGVPCHMLDTSGGVNSACAMEPGCKVDDMWTPPADNANAKAPCMEDNAFVDPWGECEWLSDTECGTNANCELKTYGGEGGDGGDGTPWCLDDCPGFDTLKQCDGKPQAECTSAAGCEWDAPDASVAGDTGSCGATINTICAFADGVNMGDNYDCVWDCPEPVMNEFYTFSSICMSCIGEYAWWDEEMGWDEDEDGDVDMDDCIDANTFDMEGEGTGGQTEDNTWTECLPKNAGYCKDFSSKQTCEAMDAGVKKCQWIEYTEYDMHSEDYGEVITECEPYFMPPEGGGNASAGSDCFAMDEMTCKTANNGCDWRMGPPDPMNPNAGMGHCEPEMVRCEEFASETTCEEKNECFWDIPPEFWGQTGGCVQIDECRMYHNEDQCYQETEKGCAWGDGFDDEPFGCYTAQNDQFCDCALEIQDASTCTAAGGTWGRPMWADEWEDIKVCTIALTEADCYEMEEFQSDDPCAEDLEAMGYNQYIDWISDESICEITFTETEAGEWNVNDQGELCLLFEDAEEEEINCAEQNTEEECYCGDCEWRPASFGQPAKCVPMQQNPRVKEKFLLTYNKAINQLASDPEDDLECMPFTVDAEGNITITIIDPDGFCQMVKLTKVVEDISGN